MNYRTLGIGVYHSPGKISSAGLISLEVIQTKSPGKLHPTLRKCILNSLKAIENSSNITIDINPDELTIQSGIDSNLLQGSSFGLAVFFSLAASIFKTGCRDDIVYTGCIDESGAIKYVKDVDLKKRVNCDERILVIPFENDPDGNIIADGSRVIRAKNVSELLWIGLNTSYLRNWILTDKTECSDKLFNYLDNCHSEGLLPNDLGIELREIYKTNDFKQVLNSIRLQLILKLIRFAPLSDPNPFNLLQSIFFQHDWQSLVMDVRRKAEHVVSDLFKELIQNNYLVEARDFFNLYLLSRNNEDLISNPGPIKDAIAFSYNFLHETNNQDGYQALFHGQLGLLKRIANSNHTDADLLKSLQDAPLITEIIHDRTESDFKLGRLRYYFQGQPLSFEIESPMALLDCSYHVPSKFQKDDWNPEMDVTISHPDGRLMLKNFSPQVFKFNRFNIEIMWQDGFGCWPPSIDSLHFLSQLLNHNMQSNVKQKTRILDLCCGTGIIGIAIAKLGGMLEVHFADIEKTACATTRLNINRNFGGDNEWKLLRSEKSKKTDGINSFSKKINSNNYVVHQSEAIRFLMNLSNDGNQSGTYFDQIFFTPPYVPDPDILGINMWRATGGTDLLEWVISNGHKFTGDLVVSYSRIAEIKVMRALNHSKNINSIEELGSEWVALRIPGFMDAFETIKNGQRAGKMTKRAETYWNMYLSSLRKTDELYSEGILPHDGHGFKYAHEVVFKRIKYNL